VTPSFLTPEAIAQARQYAATHALSDADWMDREHTGNESDTRDRIADALRLLPALLDAVERNQARRAHVLKWIGQMSVRMNEPPSCDWNVGYLTALNGVLAEMRVADYQFPDPPHAADQGMEEKS
jgi:hypothetical protein